MKPIYKILTSVALLSLLAACSNSKTPMVEEDPIEPTEPEIIEPADPEPAEEVAETKNVFYHGLVESAGISIYQEGTHKLTQPDATFILLESDTVDLNGYVGEEVDLFGSVRPTVEAGGMIMRVDKAVAVITEEETPETETEDPTKEEADTTETEDPTEVEDPEPEDETTTEEESAESSESDAERQAKIDAQIAKMEKQEYAAANWSLEYCSSHIGFCIPVHKYFWYGSFGATDEDLWHVELGTEKIENIGDGVVTVQLMPGDLPAGKASRTVATSAGKAIGYVEWEKGYFIVTAPESLVDIVKYIVTNLTEYTEEEAPEA